MKTTKIVIEFECDDFFSSPEDFHTYVQAMLEDINDRHVLSTRVLNTTQTGD